ncbi:probable E3 ubiquitin-protein ligase MGRN1 isoform X2 [Centruroides sculpturatus]|uniref:probable E3 ubiquitin-protein ligase MGRN1 isoform X2 n=1 Tax=Centruroides sculpturatus TaxID=218467 RepID=UPI000C6D051E|nr:probable E3 ubiquitin-protein ligase MGRN1 isoform X2 [Centruroides sculpturatus]
MGTLFTRQNVGMEEVDMNATNAYRYPSRTGNYFASHFIMGGERFETTQPEAYLFGENMDLNFLGNRPTPFPYPAPQPNEPTRTLRSLINIRKESLRFVNYTPRDPSMNSETYHYKRGANQQFNQVSHTFDPTKYTEEELNYQYEDEIMPVVIQCVAEEGDEPRQSHVLIAVVEKNADNIFSVKPLKQKLFIDGLCYLLQEIYGIENKNVFQPKDISDDEVEDSGSECVICMCDARDTLILPCRHLCLCNSCADSLRYQANNCPICRAPFRALLQIRAVQKCSTPLQINSCGDNQVPQDVPPGYEAVPLIEALNGPVQQPLPLSPSPIQQPHVESPDISQKLRSIERLHSNSAASLRALGNSTTEKEPINNCHPQEENESSPEVLSPILSPDKATHKSETLSLTRGEAKRHRKGIIALSAPEKVRLLSDSLHIVNEINSGKKKDMDVDVAETKSLLEGNTAGNQKAAVPSSVCHSVNNSVFLSTPHSLHLCEGNDKSAMTDASPGGDDSDYYTPEDPNTTILVDQGTDTSLDASQETEMTHISECKRNNESPSVKWRHNGRDWRKGEAEAIVICENNEKDEKTNTCIDMPNDHGHGIQTQLSPSRFILMSHLEGSLPGTPASNASNRSSGDSFSSTSSTRFLLPHQSHETLPE